jgi:hypothetical protein
MGRFWQVVWTSYFTRQNLPTRETKTLVVTGILRVLSKASITESRLLTAVVPMRESNRIWQDLSIESHFAGTDCPRNSSFEPRQRVTPITGLTNEPFNRREG